MRYNPNLKKQSIVRNPITGEEVNYQKTVLVSNPSNESKTVKHENQGVLVNSKKTDTNISNIAVAGSIPLLDLFDDSNESETETNILKSKNNLSKKPLAKHNQSVLNLNPVEKRSAEQKPLDSILLKGIEESKKISKIVRVENLENLWLSSRDLDSPLQNDEKLSERKKETDRSSIWASNEAKLNFKFNRILQSENPVSKNFKFSCRLMSGNGRLAMLELFGILFSVDGSLTIYELKRTNSSNKKTCAVPFIDRRVHKHVYGRRKNEPISFFDIYNGNVIYFKTIENPGLPTDAKVQEFIKIEITDVNEADREKFLNKNDDQARLKNPRNEMEIYDEKVKSSVRNFLQGQIKNRSVEVYMGLSRFLRQRTQETSTYLPNETDCVGLHEAFNKFDIKIHSEDMRIAWKSIDLDSKCQMPIYELIRFYLGEMNSLRHAYFRRLIEKLDPQKTGFVKTIDVRKFYLVHKHPRVRSGELGEDDIYEKFFQSFDLIDPKILEFENDFKNLSDLQSMLISYEQLEEYYNGLSIVIDSDNDFIKIFKNSWIISL